MTVLGCVFRSQPQPDILRAIILVLRWKDCQLIGAEGHALLHERAANLLRAYREYEVEQFEPRIHRRFAAKQARRRSEERRVGKEGVSKCRSRWVLDH